MNSLLPKSRARQVCMQCHGRKTKCDLQESLDNVCSFCRKYKTRCVRRESRRNRKRRHEGKTPCMSVTSALPLHFSRPDVSLATYDDDAETFGDSDNNAAYIAEHCILQNGDQQASPAQPRPRPQHTTPATEADSNITSTLAAKVLQATNAHILPRPVLRQVLFDAYFDNLNYSFLMIDRSEVESTGSPILLQQAVCLAGSLLRHPSLPDTFLQSRAIYDKVKLLISINYEQDMLVVLKALLLLTLWSPAPSHLVCLDGPWHTTGAAIRLASQMGMHKNSTYAGKPDRACRRRMWWLIYTCDCIQALMYGRLPALNPRDFDVPPLDDDDFDHPGSVDANNYIANVSLATIMGQLAFQSLRRGATQPASLQESDATQLLSDWRSGLPSNLSLHDDATGRRTTYYFPIAELHAQYFGTIILSQAVTSQFAKHWPCSTVCLVAAACMASLYEEILYRDQLAILTPMHAFWCLAAAIPLIHYKPPAAAEALEAQRRASLDVLCAVIEKLRLRFGVARSVAHKLSVLLSERSDILTQQHASEGLMSLAQVSGGGSSSSSPSNANDNHNNVQLGGERDLLHALFPQLASWSSAASSSPEEEQEQELLPQNAILRSVAQSHSQRAAQGWQSPMEWICDLPLSMLDIFGDAALLEPFMDDQYTGNDSHFQLHHSL